jgi:hypothetical protein
VEDVFVAIVFVDALNDIDLAALWPLSSAFQGISMTFGERQSHAGIYRGFCKGEHTKRPKCGPCTADSTWHMLDINHEEPLVVVLRALDTNTVTSDTAGAEGGGIVDTDVVVISDHLN